MSDKEILVTAKGLEKLQTELRDFKEVRRPEVINRIKAAKELGDLSENAEYATAKEEQSFIEGRIQELEQIVKRARVVANTNGGKTIQTGSRATVEIGGEDMVFEIVGQTEADPVNNRISLDSPVGQALLGHKAGERVKVQTPDGAASYKVLKVE